MDFSSSVHFQVFYSFCFYILLILIILIVILCCMQAPRTTGIHAWSWLSYRRDTHGKWWVLDSYFIALVSLYHTLRCYILHFFFCLHSILEAYRTGRGRIVMRGKTVMETIDEKTKRTAIIINEVWFLLVFSEQCLFDSPYYLVIKLPL